VLDQPAKDPRQPGATFALGDIGWIDFETKSETPITAGTDRYSNDAKAIMLAWAIGDGPVHVETVPGFMEYLRWGDMPAELQAFLDRVEAGEAVLAAHNATFDRNIWNRGTYLFPPLTPEMIIDTRAQAAASGLPADLDKAAEYATEVRKAEGEDYIKLFCVPGAPGTPQTHPVEWQAFVEYAKADIVAMRALFIGTRQLPIAEWDEYWAAEAINARGIGIDLDMVSAAAAIAAEDRKRSAIELSQLTNDAVGSADEVKNITAWLLQILPPDVREILSQTGHVAVDAPPRRAAAGLAGGAGDAHRRLQAGRARAADPPLRGCEDARQVPPHARQPRRRRHPQPVRLQRRQPDRQVLGEGHPGPQFGARHAALRDGCARCADRWRRARRHGRARPRYAGLAHAVAADTPKPRAPARACIRVGRLGEHRGARAAVAGSEQGGQRAPRCVPRSRRGPVNT
jgi:hypothetical protein